MLLWTHSNYTLNNRENVPTLSGSNRLSITHKLAKYDSPSVCVKTYSPHLRYLCCNILCCHMVVRQASREYSCFAMNRSTLILILYRSKGLHPCKWPLTRHQTPDTAKQNSTTRHHSTIVDTCSIPLNCTDSLLPSCVSHCLCLPLCQCVTHVCGTVSATISMLGMSTRY
jgi:hypothetical protein